jgi:hypothetical protein
MLEVQNNLMWLPTVTNFHSVLVFRATVHASASSGASTVARRNICGGTAIPAPITGTPRCDAGPCVRNPSLYHRVIGNTPFAHLVKIRTVSQAIAKASCDPPLEW